MEKKVSPKKLYNVVIIGSGIAGSALAYEFEKIKMNYFICTCQKSSLINTSSISNAHCRTNKNLKKLISLSVKKFGENKQRVNHIYSNTKLVIDFFNEINVDIKEKTFGIIPKDKKGKDILKILQKNIPIKTNTELIDFKKEKGLFKIKLKENNKEHIIYSKYLVLATGGYGGTFEHTNNFKYKNYNVFDLIKKNKGLIINKKTIFRHPFSYNNSKQILIGDEISKGKFVDSKNNLFFSEKINKLIKENTYHEEFDKILKEIDAKKDQELIFIKNNKKIKIKPTVHYTAGGIKCDKIGRVKNIKNLFAIGECRADGSKNEGRLPGYPFPSAIIDAITISKLFEENNTLK